MIPITTTRDYHRMIDDYINKNKQQNSDDFITTFVELLGKLEKTYINYGRAIINYLVYKLEDLCDLNMLYRIHIEILSINFDLAGYTDIHLTVYTKNILNVAVSSLLQTRLNSLSNSTELVSPSDLFGIEYVNDIMVFFRRQSFTILTTSNEKNYGELLRDTLKFTKLKKIEFVENSNQGVLFNKVKMLDSTRYIFLNMIFGDRYCVEAFISECVLMCADVTCNVDDKHLEIDAYHTYISKELLDDLKEYIKYSRVNINQVIINEDWFIDKTFDTIRRFRDEIQSNFKINIQIDWGDRIFKSFSNTYRRLRNAIVLNFILMELCDLVIRNLLSSVPRSEIYRLLEEVDSIISKYTNVLKVMEGEFVYAQFSE